MMRYLAATLMENSSLALEVLVTISATLTLKHSN